jgi:hypothetical protein
MVEELLGLRPPEKEPGTKGSKTAGLKLVWLEENFGNLPEEADEITAQRYARAYVMYVFGKVLFANSGVATCLGCFCLYCETGMRQGGIAGVRLG